MDNYLEHTEHNIEPPNRNYGNSLGIASLVLGISSLIGLCMCMGPVTGIIAIVFGIIQIKRTPENRAFAITGIVTGAIGILLSLFVLGVLAFGVTVDTDSDSIRQFYDTFEQYYDI